jgi:hypothetical protein
MDNTRESLLIFTRRQIAKTLASAFLLGGAQFSRHCANALGFLGEAVAAPASSALAMLTLVNSGGSTQPSGVPTQSFGRPFKDGDIAPGAAPQFTVAGVRQAFSAGLQSLRFSILTITARGREKSCASSVCARCSRSLTLRIRTLLILTPLGEWRQPA